ncbi:unnamed protein product [Moneuplotes crassus]|uniref:Palmitoyltransferase n=2 Tax=Euplotes crassus TaxID=5936 RepID=A0AAD1U5A2_EUPCR|nr:unnamed protein product [Moneuplotes crassus]
MHRHFSGDSFSQDGECDLDSSEPRIRRVDAESSTMKSAEGAASNDQTLNFRPENSRQLPQEKSSSLTSSSKTSLGFLNDFYSNVVDLIKYRNLDKLEAQLEQNDDVFGPIDITKKTILHYACEFNSLEICKLIVDCLFRRKKRTNLKLNDWVNCSNSDGLTSVHFAAYRGNNELIRYLVNLGADIYAQDNDGHNCVHIAAQSDKVNTIYYLIKNYGFDINQGDNNNSTALHWAAFLNKENALTYLLAWGADPNRQDIDNNTPLHLSVISACRGTKTLNIKLLLLKGASRTLTNNDLCTPLDLVKAGDHLENELREILKETSVVSCFMLRAPLAKMRKNERTVAFFLVMIFTVMILSFLYVIPTFKSNLVAILSGVFGIYLFVSFGGVTIKNPGYLEQDPDVDFQELLNTLDPLDICPECEIILTPRCRHCNICNKCVERFDHHCPYINNCVGYSNHGWFLSYVFSMALNIIHHIALCSLALARGEDPGTSLVEEMDNIVMFYVSCSIILIICGIFVLPVIFLVFIHITNFMKNKTTNERFSKQKVNNTSLTNKITNSVGDDTSPSILVNVEYNSFMGKQHKSCFSNCASMCNYKPPSQLEMRNEIMNQD